MTDKTQCAPFGVIVRPDLQDTANLILLSIMIIGFVVIYLTHRD